MGTYKDWLAHYGIQGMHWGERNGPPYPLSTRQMTAEEIKERKRGAKLYNKELKEAQGNKAYKKADKKFSKDRETYIYAREQLATNALKRKVVNDLHDSGEYDDKKYNKEIERIDASTFKFHQQLKQMNDWYGSEEGKHCLDIYRKGNEKVKEILNRAENEGGYELVIKSGDNRLNVPASLAASVAANAAIYGGINAITIPTAGVLVYPVVPAGVPIMKTDTTDRYRVKAGKEIADTNRKESTVLPTKVQAEVWKETAKIVEKEGLTSVGADVVNRAAKQLSTDASSEYYKYLHSK